ncbi:MAG: MFS transporter [Rhodobacteraceae bacterium]|nr:MFS transporter [Paracoccaceae bacterium]
MNLRVDMGLSWRKLLPPAMVATVLAFAGLPLYIHVPLYFAEEMGLGLGLLGLVLLASRAVDSIQDPLIGKLADRWPQKREYWTILSGLLLSVGILLLFTPPDWGEALPRLIFGLLAAFTGLSALQIALYDHGLAQAETAGGFYTRIALWREAGGLMGICLAAAAPALFGMILGASTEYVGYAMLFFVVMLASLSWMRGNWQASRSMHTHAGFAAALGSVAVRPLLIFGFCNALPTAVTSTLFLFFVTDILVAKSHAGLLLMVFFSSAACAAPIWASLARHIGRKSALLWGMSLSVPIFMWAWTLGEGDLLAFYIIAGCTGVALGADMILAPAMLAARIRGGGGKVFSLWTFLQKSALAVAAGITMPILALAGYTPGSSNVDGHDVLAVAYALVPCLLKLVAIPVLWIFVSDEGDRN